MNKSGIMLCLLLIPSISFSQTEETNNNCFHTLLNPNELSLLSLGDGCIFSNCTTASAANCNLVLNGSFENTDVIGVNVEYNECEGEDEVHCWYPGAGIPYGSTGTPDVINSPDWFSIYQAPALPFPEGSNVLHCGEVFFINNQGEVHAQENICQELSAPLVPGEEYQVSFDYSYSAHQSISGSPLNPDFFQGEEWYVDTPPIEVTVAISIDSDPLIDHINTLGFNSDPDIGPIIFLPNVIDYPLLEWQSFQTTISIPEDAEQTIQQFYIYLNTEFPQVLGQGDAVINSQGVSHYLDNIRIEPLVDIAILTHEVTNAACDGESGAIDITATADTDMFEWKLGGEVISTQEDISNLSAGVYELTISNSLHMCSETVEYVVGLNCCENENATPLIISDSQWWDGVAMNFWDDILIQSGASLTLEECSLYFATDVNIIVEPGGYLNVEGGLLDALPECQYQWGGIEVHGNSNLPATDETQGRIRMINATLKNAYYGVTLGEVTAYDAPVWGSGGAFGNFNGCKFLNNQSDVFILNYNYGLSPVSIVSCVSELDDNYLELASYPSTRMAFHERDGIELINCHFYNNSPSLLADESNGIGLTAIKSFDAPFVFRSLNTDEIQCEVDGFSYGIRATGGTNLFHHLDAVRFSCYRGVYLNEASFSHVFRNEFYSLPLDDFGDTYPTPSVPSTFETTDYLNIENADNTSLLEGSYGVYLAGATIGRVEDNYFDMGGNIGSTGLIATRTESYMQPIYNNIFSNAENGVKFYDQNRSEGTPISGLEFECNDFISNVLDVELNALSLDGIVGIIESVGSFDFGASNSFDDGGGFLEEEHIVSFISEAAHFYYVTENPNEPQATESVSVTYFNAEEALPCDSYLEFILEDSGDFESTKIELWNQYLDKESQWLDLVDGGNTDELTADVINTEFSEALVLYYELMSKSPNLSEKVMLESIHKEFDLPMVLLKQILRSNPQAAKSKKIQEELDNRMMPLPEYMREEIMQGLTWVSEKETLEKDMLGIKKNYQRLEMLEYAHIAADISILDIEEQMNAIMLTSHFPETAIERATRLSFWGHEESALQFLELELAELDSDTKYFDQIQERINLLELVIDLKSGVVVWSEDIQQEVLVEAGKTHSPICNQARRLVEQHSGKIFLEEVNYPQIQMNYRASGQPNPEAANSYLKMYPNPTSAFLLIENQYPVTENAVLEIIDSKGSTQLTALVSDQPNQLLDVNELLSGVYFLLLIDEGHVITKNQFVKN